MQEVKMATIIHKSELVRRAIIYLDQLQLEKPCATKMELVEEASMRFNLGPADAADLERLFRERTAKK